MEPRRVSAWVKTFADCAQLGDDAVRARTIAKAHETGSEVRSPKSEATGSLGLPTSDLGPVAGRFSQRATDDIQILREAERRAKLPRSEARVPDLRIRIKKKS